MSLRAALNRCKPITVTPRSPVRHVKASYPSSATRDIPAQTTPSFPEVAVENTATVSKADVVLNANATELETRCDESGALKTKEKVVDSVHPEPKHQSVPTNHSVLEPETRSGQSGVLPTKSMSLNLTKMVALMNGYSSDDADEVESRHGHLSFMVGKYRVKKEASPLLEKIFHKYGVIALSLQ
ncbi:hypothetical protein K7X08_024043 [Anisodus acutangulus]|uniref:Uncharacterized protein n=1 Tax=Anisodus acutangulus TaxID=402998 RepID=A0A9Q1M709_9SOLA|nr:hypothetical protein K7X08_024043 [Anisodus acutangulus]